MRAMFVSECKKRALKETRKVLDLYASRVGERTWIGEFTEKGLEVVHEKLSGTRTKDTAVQCIIVNRKTQERKWIVGNRDVFDSEGKYPVATTKKTKPARNESEFSVISVVAPLTALSALLHDLGKMTAWFQRKLRKQEIIADPVRHEYISCMLLNLFIKSIGAKTDRDWLEKLPEIDFGVLFDEMGRRCRVQQDGVDAFNPFIDMDMFPVYMYICWLIVSHHKLPYTDAPVPDHLNLDRVVDWKSLGYYVYSDAGYEHRGEYEKPEDNVKLSCPFDSEKWRKKVGRYSRKLIGIIDAKSHIFKKPDYTILMLSLHCLMYGDHTFSAKDCRNELGKSSLYANTITINEKRTFNQVLEQHLIGVCDEAVSKVHEIPKMLDLDEAYDIEWLNKKSTGRFRWQDIAAEKIAATSRHGIFIVNIAGTGSGKTLANAKMAKELGRNGGLRFTLALGMRSLTLQAGSEYRRKLGLLDADLCVCIGSKEYTDLAGMDFDEDSEPEQETEYYEGGRSGKRSTRVLNTPVVVATIDQPIKATETVSGGRGLDFFFRQISSDIIIDEVDDFTESSLVSVARQIYQAGVFGRNVIISSATIPPEISLLLKYYYDLGYAEFAKWNGCSRKTTSLVVDEFCTEEFCNEQEYHDFCKKHVKRIMKQEERRKREIVNFRFESVETSIDNFDQAVLDTIEKMHERHGVEVDRKKVSFGIVRIANVSEMDQLVIRINGKNPNIIPLVYHAKFPMYRRFAIESYLDRLMNRKDPDAIYKDPAVASHIARANKDAIFVLFASPVEELGRDHDFDWAIIEPSSMRSIIQMAGRVLRHRLICPSAPNIAILQYNMKHIKNPSKPCFRHPGFETERKMFTTHDMNKLISNIEGKEITSAPRVLPADEVDEEFAVYEHEASQSWLSVDNTNAENVMGYINGFYMTAIPQKKARLRERKNDVRLIYKKVEKYRIFVDGEDKKKRKSAEKLQHIERMMNFTLINSWLCRDDDSIIEEIAEKKGKTKAWVENRYGIIDIEDNKENNNRKLMYHPELGMFSVNI